MFYLFSLAKEIFLEFLFPSFCLGCGSFGTYLCQKCYASIYFYPFPPRLNLDPNYLDEITILTHYASPVKELIIAYKYRRGKILVHTLADLIYHSIIFGPVDLLTFVPLHPEKENKRGFNQTKLLADALAEKLKIPCQNMLIKNKHHRAQAETNSKAERLINVIWTFCIDPKFTEFVKTCKSPPTSVMIVDDVITTGSTLNEAARILKTIGIKKVYGFALAHD